MQHDEIGAIAEIAQQRAFVVGRTIEHPERAVGGCGHDYAVMAAAVAPFVDDRHAVRIAQDLRDAGTVADVAGIGRRQPLHIFLRSPRHRAPLRARGELEQTVIGEEACEGRRGIGRHVVDGGRPDRGAHRQEMQPRERFGIIFRFQIFAERHLPRRGIRQKFVGFAIEAHRVAQHAPIIAFQKRGRLRDEARQRSGIFEPAVVERHRERHFAGARRHVEVAEQGREIGIVRFVVDDEARIDRHRAAGRFDFDRVRVATDPRLAFIDRHAMMACEQPGGGHSRNAGADDRKIGARSGPSDAFNG